MRAWLKPLKDITPAPICTVVQALGVTLNKSLANTQQTTFLHFPPCSDMENDALMLVWQVVNELSEQLAHNQKLTAALQSQAGVLKVSTDIPKTKVLLMLIEHLRNKLPKLLLDSLYVVSMQIFPKVRNNSSSDYCAKLCL